MILVKEEFLTEEKTIRAMRMGGPAVIILWLALKGYVARKNTAGFVPDEAVDDLLGAPRRPRVLLKTLVECGLTKADGSRGSGLVDQVDHGWQLHDYDDHGTSQTVEELRREKARTKKAEQRRRQQDEIDRLKAARMGPDVPADVPGTDEGHEGDTDGDMSPGHSGSRPAAPGREPAPARALTRSQPSPAQPSGEKRDFPSIDGSAPGRPRDPFGDSLRGRRTQDDPGVVAVFQAWRLAHGSVSSKFRQPFDPRADILFEAVQTHGVETCLRAIEASKTDGMVTGKTDERGQDHRRIEYLFGPSTFDRLLRAADAAKPVSARADADAEFEAAMRADAQ